MLTNYELNNFKAFSGRQHIPIRPITLVYGQNSSGKSCILQSLLLLKQTIDGAENPSTLLLPKGNLVDLGGYREFINSHDVSKPFSFKVEMPVPDREYFLPPVYANAMKRAKAKSLGFEVAFGFDEKAGTARLDSLDLYIGETPAPALSYKTEKRETKRQFPGHLSYAFSVPRSGVGDSLFRVKHLNSNHPFWSALWETSKQQIDKDALPSLSKRYEALKRRIEQFRGSEPAEIDDSGKTARELRLEKELNKYAEIRSRLENYTFVEAIKDFERMNQHALLFCKNYLPVGLGYEEKGRAENFPDFLEFVLPPDRYGYGFLPGLVLRACSLFEGTLENTVYIGPLRDYPERHYIFSGNLTEQVGKSGKMVPDVLFKNSDLLAKVNQQLDAFGLGYELKVSSVGDPSSDLQDVFALRLFDKSTKVHASILDVGFGISQVLPIIVQSMLSRKKTLCIEQPEIHLHPRLQADLGSLIAECSRPPYDNQFLIETHSQHILLRLQKLIRHGKLDPNSIAIIYVNRTSSGSQCLHLRLDKDGDFIDEWPGGFFEEGYGELF